MDLFALLNFDGASFDEFVIFGWVMNIISLMVVFIATLFRSSTLDEKELHSILSFSKTRTHYIKNYTAAWRQLGAFLLMFVPTYVAWINMVYLFYMFKNPGSWGIIKGTIESDKWEIIQLIRYETVNRKG